MSGRSSRRPVNPSDQAVGQEKFNDIDGVVYNGTPGPNVCRIWDWKTATGGNGDGIVVDLASNEALRVITAGQSITVNPAIPTGRWIDLVVAIGVDGVRNVYVDGARVGGGNFNSPGINGCADGATLRLGADQAGGQSIPASVDRAAIFTTALSATDVTKWQQLAFVDYTNVEVPIGGQVPTGRAREAT